MSAAERPYTLIAELHYACPLRCAYCSNPVDYAQHTGPAQLLPTERWLRVFEEAEALGVVQVHLTGGEPLLHQELDRLVAGARALDLYTNVITGGIPLDRRRLHRLRDCGLDAVQLSFQADRPGADRMAGVEAFESKLAVARWVKEAGLPLTVNVVLHRENIDRVREIVALAERLAADRLELANVQYLGWALLNRRALLPTRDQLARARAAALEAKARLRGAMEVVFVIPDYYADVPRSCMEGWGRRYLVIAPDGLALPCHAARSLPGFVFDNVRDRPLAAIWQESEAFNRFRGDAWMPSPCRTCDSRQLDFGGCRCQAFHLLGDPAATDPACRWSPAHQVVLEARAEAEEANRAGAPALRLRSPAITGERS